MKRFLRMDTASRAIISQTFGRTGAPDIASEELAIDIDALEPRDYVLTVSAVDRISGERARASKPFVKLGGTLN